MRVQRSSPGGEDSGEGERENEITSASSHLQMMPISKLTISPNLNKLTNVGYESCAMSKRAAIFLAVLALILGAIAGGWIVTAIYSHRTNRMIMDYKYRENQMAISSLTSDAEIRVHELRHLRAGNTSNMIEEEEGFLEGDLINLELYVADRNDIVWYPPYMDAIREVKAYRSEFPPKEPPSVEKGVAEVFTLLDGQTNR